MAPTREEVLHAAELLRSGRLVAFPTETVYGLGANALDPAAVLRIFEAKGRPRTSPLIVHVDSVEMARSCVVSAWPETAERLAERWWPGPLTLVLPKRSGVPDEVTADLPTVGVRVPAEPLALELIREAGIPVAAPSANRFTQLSPTTAQHVREGLGDRVDAILDGGPCVIGIESTVLSLSAARPVLLRPGLISRTALEEVIGPVELKSEISDGESHPSPGLHHKHYSPRTPLRIGSGGVDERTAWVYRTQPQKTAGRQVIMPDDAAGYAHVLYQTLHTLDAENWDCIAVEDVPETPEWAGVRDRLRRAV
jgi:L-threonylcarbamoyladenylate synthase